MVILHITNRLNGRSDTQEFLSTEEAAYAVKVCHERTPSIGLENEYVIVLEDGRQVLPTLPMVELH